METQIYFGYKNNKLSLKGVNAGYKLLEGIVVNDPKGELYYYTHRVLQSLGYEVIVMDLQNPEKSCGKNLLQPIIDAVNEKMTDKAQRATWDLKCSFRSQTKANQYGQMVKRQ